MLDKMHPFGETLAHPNTHSHTKLPTRTDTDTHTKRGSIYTHGYLLTFLDILIQAQRQVERYTHTPQEKCAHFSPMQNIWREDRE